MRHILGMDSTEPEMVRRSVRVRAAACPPQITEEVSLSESTIATPRTPKTQKGRSPEATRRTAVEN